VAQALTLAVSGPTSSPEYLPLRVAEAEGHFAKEGLVVTLKTTRAEPGAAEALAQGQADLVATSLEAMLRFGPRTPKQAPRLVLGLTAAPPVALVVAESQKELVRSLEDLPGTRVGVTAPGAPEQAWLAWLLARAGLSPAQVWLVSRGDRGLQHAVETGDVHTALVREPAASRLLAAGQARLLVDLRTPAAVSQALGAATVNAAVFMRADRAVRDRDLAAFTRAVLAAERRVATATAQALSERLPTSITVPADDFEARLAGCRDLYLADGAVTVEQVRETLTVIPRRKSCCTCPGASSRRRRRCADRHAEPAQQRGRGLERQAHDVAPRALQAGHQRAALALDRVGAGLVERLTGGHVGLDRRVRVGGHRHAADHGLGGMASGRRVQNHHAGHDLVRPPAQRSQHRARVGGVGGLAERAAVDHDDRVGREHESGPP